eukprot:CAMPEP_0185623100 /NCGR_PEP_ID=MMETSP0436-20130131/59641_1 /TAXON_ID=626734 ORGANISM="Favella taraikaensis, Strain Fe Narragansett Bay" /NCGR_SAMPLE_ID=MMETSP0436 /ASSEMBLY_ACC=CAM_ASM_000390 /LENGTH=70 /DNA_ID=CAMNT_0028265009 /DNA_START=1573 /DNA_END=1781 /DNA_ORIENTATION=-
MTLNVSSIAKPYRNWISHTMLCVSSGTSISLPLEAPTLSDSSFVWFSERSAVLISWSEAYESTLLGAAYV